MAQQDAKPDDIVVTATGRSAAVSTTKSAQPIIESPPTISIVNKAELNLRPSTKLLLVEKPPAPNTRTET